MGSQFSQDWFSPNIGRFERYLMPLAGQPLQALEIGAHEGRSAVWMLQNVLTNPASHLTTIDLVLQPNFWANVEVTGTASRVTFLQEPSRRALKRLPEDSFDFCYVDGHHGTIYVLEDAVLTWPLLRVGALLAFDDYRWNDPKFNQEGTPKPAVDAFLKLYKPKLRLLEKGYQVWVQKTAA